MHQQSRWTAIPSRLIGAPPLPSPPFLCRMPFLTQPSQFILAWDRHQIYWLSYPVAWFAWVVETVENAEENERCQQVGSVTAARNQDGKYFSSRVLSSFLKHNAQFLRTTAYML